MAEPQTGVVTTGAALASLGQGGTPRLVEDSGAAWCIVLSLIKSSLCWEGRLLSVQPFPEAPIHNTVGVPRTLLTGLLRICEQLESQALFGNDCWPSPAFSSTCLSSSPAVSPSCICAPGWHLPFLSQASAVSALVSGQHHPVDFGLTMSYCLVAMNQVLLL